MTSKEMPSSTTSGIPVVAPRATRKTAFSIVSSARICVTALRLVTMRKSPISSMEREAPITWWAAPPAPPARPVLTR
jgi:hypothetical protein